MLFNSLEFLFLFLPATLLAFFVIARHSRRAAIGSLAIASVFFYSWWDIRFLPVLLASILFNYGMAQCIARAQNHRKLILGLAIGGDLAALFFYKYLDFSIISLNASFGLSLPLPQLALPLGISFFTFTQIAYLVDVHRQKADTSSLINYVLFVTYFPHLIAGPILHHSQMMPQFKSPAVFQPNGVALAGGLLFLTIGLIKKILIADEMASYATPVFSVTPGQHMGMAEAWTGALSYTLQLYFDFSGYCDMALGISLMLNIQLPLNFSSPYKATNIIEFWRRWHMTLSQFLRDYLYISLGGNRHGKWRRYLNLFLTMLLGGLWHGANWTFVIWGCLHGIYLIINHGIQALRQQLKLAPPPAFLAGLLTFIAVVFAWVPFRADSISHALTLWEAMLSPTSIVNFTTTTLSGIRLDRAVRWIVGGCMIVFLLPNSQTIVARFQALLAENRLRTPLIVGILLGILFSFTIMNIGHVSEFLYFQF